jgi:hypothetical protein
VENYPAGIRITVNGADLQTAPGTLQEPILGMVSLLDQVRETVQPGSSLERTELHNLLNREPWDRIYADWKIFWAVFLQIDLNIGNLALQGSDAAIFDLADSLNSSQVRFEMGVRTDCDRFLFNLPGQPSARVLHIPDFRRADPQFKELPAKILGLSDEELASRMGRPDLDQPLGNERPVVRMIIREVKTQARWVQGLLANAPF